MQEFKRTTESESGHHDLENKTVSELLIGMNEEDQTVPNHVAKCIPQIEALIHELVPRMKEGGRLFYIGAGTSGRLGIVDASECPPTFGIPHGWVIGIIAGGDGAIRKAVEFAEDSETQGWNDLQEYGIDSLDVVVGIAASGTTPYVLHALKKCREKNILTACITCNPGAPIIQFADLPVVCEVGPEFLTGSTRLKSGTAQKLILNMISTATMIRLGRVKGNKMVDMQLTNNKLIDRGVRMIVELKSISESEARKILLETGSVREALSKLK
jgi:N-acetylmuramic acid 6-phosphate etherase